MRHIAERNAGDSGGISVGVDLTCGISAKTCRRVDGFTERRIDAAARPAPGWHRSPAGTGPADAETRRCGRDVTDPILSERPQVENRQGRAAVPADRTGLEILLTLLGKR